MHTITAIHRTGRIRKIAKIEDIAPTEEISLWSS